MSPFWCGFLLSGAVGMVLLVVYACLAVAARADDEEA
jgi:ABC-type uncharacterized transport system permease subunit